MECGESAGELEGNQKPLGVLSRLTVLAAADWFRAFVFSDNAAFKAVALNRNTRPSELLEVRRKQRLCYRVAWFLSACEVAVSAHINSAIGRFS